MPPKPFLPLSKTIAILALLIPYTLLTLKPIALVSFFILSLIGIYLLVTHRFHVSQNPTLKIFSTLSWGYFGVMAFSTLFAEDTFESITHLPLISHFLFAPFVAMALTKTHIPYQTMSVAIKVGTITGGVVSIIQCAFTQFSFHVRCAGIHNANTFGDLMAIFTALSLISIDTDTPKHRILSILALIFGVAGVVFSGSRGSMIALVLIILLTGWFFLRHLSHKKIAWILIATIVSIFAITLGNKTTLIHKRFSHILTELQHWNDTSAFTSVGIRAQMYASGTKAFVQRPIFGYGFFNATKAAAHFIQNNAKLRHTLATRHWHLHNEVLNTAVQAGIIGLGAFFALMLLPLRMFWRERHDNPYALMGVVLIVGYFLIGLTHTVFGYEYETAFFLFFLAYLLIGSHRTDTA